MKITNRYTQNLHLGWHSSEQIAKKIRGGGRTTSSKEGMTLERTIMEGKRTAGEEILSKTRIKKAKTEGFTIQKRKISDKTIEYIQSHPVREG